METKKDLKNLITILGLEGYPGSAEVCQEALALIDSQAKEIEKLKTDEARLNWLSVNVSTNSDNIGKWTNHTFLDRDIRRTIDREKSK